MYDLFMKKSVFIALLVFGIVLSISLVSAYTLSSFDLKGAGEQIIQWIKDIFTPFFAVLLGAESVGDKYFFARILLLLLLFFIVLTVLRRIRLFKSYPGVYYIVAAIVSILGTRYISEINLVEFILLPYGTLAVAATVFLPFLIYFWFVHKSVPGAIGRRIAWVIFGVVFFGFWLARGKELGDAGWIYLFGIIAVLIVLLLDKSFHRYFELGKYKQDDNARKVLQLVKTIKDIRDIEAAHGTNPDTYTGKTLETYERFLDEKRRLERELS